MPLRPQSHQKNAGSGDASGEAASVAADNRVIDYVAQDGHREAFRRCCGCGIVAGRCGARGRADEHRRAGFQHQYRRQADRGRSGNRPALHQGGRAHDPRRAPPPDCRAHDRVHAGRPGRRGECAGWRSADLCQCGRVPAARAVRLHARPASPASAGFGWRRHGRRLGWRFRRRRLWWRPGLWRRLLRRLLWRRRFVLGRCVGFDHHLDFGRQQRDERCGCRYRHRQFDLDHLVLGPDQFLHRPGFDLDVDRSGVEQHRRGVEHQHVGQRLLIDRRGFVFGQCLVLDRRCLVLG